MGTQQILLIVLSVIIVGIAAAVGLTMFNTQAESMNRQSISVDLQNFGAHAIAYYKTPRTLGGGGNGSPGFASVENVSLYLGFDREGAFENENGTFAITLGEDKSELVITATGNNTGIDEQTPVSVTLEVDADNIEIPPVFLTTTINN